MLGDRCIGFKSADLSDSSQINQIIESVKPTILINCAGIFPTGPIEKTSIKEFDDCFFINVRAPFLLARAAIPHMRQAGWGRIVNVGSSSAYAGFSSTAAYCASKHALLGLSRAMFHELKNEKIRVYCVSPGSIKTEMGRKVVGQDYDTFMDPEEVSSFILQIIEYDGNMISEEIRLNRMHTQ
jgi:NAD(P)-dependent dehydrogenase (short-subunit alcohol dehydrogenase family)